MNDELLNEDQAAELITMRPQTLAVWRMKGIGPKFMRVGRLVRYRKSDLLAWLDSRIVNTEMELATVH